MSMDVNRPTSPAAFRSMRRTSRPHPTVPVGQVCFRDVKNNPGNFQLYKLIMSNHVMINMIMSNLIVIIIIRHTDKICRAESSRVESSPDSPGLIIVSATDHVQLICHWACTNQIQSVSDCPKASSAKIHRHQLNAQAGPAAGETKKWGNHLDHLTVEEPLHIFAHL
jgi:hypothetical protein